MRKNFYRQAQKGICIATLSATGLTSIPTVSYAEAYAKGRAVMEEMQKLSLPTENAVTFNLADAALRQEKTFVDAMVRILLLPSSKLILQKMELTSSKAPMRSMVHLSTLTSR